MIEKEQAAVARAEAVKYLREAEKAPDPEAQDRWRAKAKSWLLIAEHNEFVLESTAKLNPASED